MISFSKHLAARRIHSKVPGMSKRSSRIYIRGSHLPFVVILSILFTAACFLIAFVQTAGESRFMLLYPVVLLFLAAYYIERASLSWIRISGDGKELVRVPSWFAKKLLNERRIVAAIEPGSEFIICRRMGYGALNGYSMILRAPDGSEQVIWDTSEPTTQHWLRRIGDQITAKHQLAVRFVSRSSSDRGMEEKEWTAESDKTKRQRIGLVLIPSLSPFLGIAVRCVTANVHVIVVAGVGLWLVGYSCYFWLVRHVKVATDQSNALLIPFWTMQFVVFYWLSVIFASHIVVPEWLGHTIR